MFIDAFREVNRLLDRQDRTRLSTNHKLSDSLRECFAELKIQLKPRKTCTSDAYSMKLGKKRKQKNENEAEGYDNGFQKLLRETTGKTKSNKRLTAVTSKTSETLT